jgi:hypothetical protein
MKKLRKNNERSFENCLDRSAIRLYNKKACKLSVEVECGYTPSNRRWRELLWSMFWLRPGGKFYK